MRRRAQQWAVRLDGGGLSARERARLKVWLRKDDHASALKSAQAAWASLNASRDTSPASAALRRWGRDARVFSGRMRARLTIGGAVLATGLALVTMMPPMLKSFRSDASTAAGEQRVLVLDDGSRVLLNSASSVDVQYTATRRGVWLLAGEARFEAAPNAKLPFVVESAGGSVTALGTVFVVRALPLIEGGGAIVTGVEHRVRVESSGQSTLVGPGQQTSWSVMRPPRRPVTMKDANATGWSTGVVQFEGAALRDIVSELNRYTSTRILVMGDARDMELSGVFLIRNPVAGLVALESSGRLRLTRLPGLLIVRAH